MNKEELDAAVAEAVTWVTQQSLVAIDKYLGDSLEKELTALPQDLRMIAFAAFAQGFAARDTEEQELADHPIVAKVRQVLERAGRMAYEQFLNGPASLH